MAKSLGHRKRPKKGPTSQAKMLSRINALEAELAEARKRQIATSDILRTIVAGDADCTLRKIAETTLQLFGAVGASFRIAEGDEFKLSVSVGAGAEQVGAALWDDTAKRPTVGGRNLPGTVVRENRQIHLADLDHLDPDIADWPGPPVARSVGIRTMIGTPLRTENRATGALTVYRDVLRPFEPVERHLLQSFADQAAIAIENARLITETREAVEQQTATAKILGLVSSSLGELGAVMAAVLENAVRLCEAKFGTLYLCEADGFRAVAMHNAPAAYAKARAGELLRPPPDAPLTRVRNTKRVTQVLDITQNRSYLEGESFVVAAADLGGYRTVLSVPMLKDDEVIGAININRQEVRAFSDRQIALLQNFAAQAVIAMENARLLGELRRRTEEVAELNRGLEARVAEQVEELGRVSRLKRFLAPQLAELIVSRGDEKILESHRREIVVVFCDLRGYTAFTETAEPEEVLDFLREYHGALGPLVSQFEGTLDQFSGDGIMVFFNDPVPIPDPAERAISMAVAMRDAAGSLIAHWRERGRDLGFGAGIAQGYATLGQIGFSERSGYTAIGTVCNVAARLCAEAKDAQILLSQRVNVALKGSVPTEQLGALTLKGLTQPVVAYNVPLAASHSALRVIEGGSLSD